MDVRQREQHILLVGAENENNLVEGCISDGLLQRVVNITGLIEVYPPKVHSSVSEHYFEQKLTKFIRVVFLVSREMDIHIIRMSQALLNEGGVPAMRQGKASEGGSAGVTHLVGFHHAVSMARFEAKRKGG